MTDEECPACATGLDHGFDRMGYEMSQCPACGLWTRPSFNEYREPPDEWRNDD